MKIPILSFKLDNFSEIGRFIQNYVKNDFCENLNDILQATTLDLYSQYYL